jgi:hypothetical protein
LDPDIRRSPSEVRKLLAEEFMEVGSGGDFYDREAIIAALGSPTDYRFTLTEFQTITLSEGVVLATYRTIRSGRLPTDAQHSLRCSIWKLVDRQWRMVFHQGTPARQPTVGTADRSKRDLLRHFLAAIAYRSAKSLRDAPDEFGSFTVGESARTPAEIVRHMDSVLGYARTFFTGGTYRAPVLPEFEETIDHYFATLADLARHIADGGTLVAISEEQLIQGPLADAMTHVGQLAMLRRLAGSPVAPENFVFADIDPANLTLEQPPPVRPDKKWPESPGGSKEDT